MAPSKITADLLREMVGEKRGRRPLCDTLVGPLNLILPAYEITTEFRISAFLATCAPETDWFRTLREYGTGKGRAYGKPAGPYGLIYYGRGIFQVTWLKNVKAFTKYVAENWEWIKPRALRYKYTVPPDFVKEPELLATPYWAVEAACWYWKVNGLQKYADRGLKGFFGLQGLVNRGSATKKALHYEARLNSYEIARRLIPDDFDLASSAAESPDKANGSTSDEQAAASGSPGGTPGSSQDQPPTEKTASVNITDGNINAEVNIPPSQNVVVEKEKDLVIEKPKGFFRKLWAKFTTATGTAITTDIAIEKAQQAQTLGLSERTWTVIFWVILGALTLWILYELWVQKVWPFLRWFISWLRTHHLMNANSTPTNQVKVEAGLTPERIKELEDAGWLVIRRA